VNKFDSLIREKQQGLARKGVKIEQKAMVGVGGSANSGTKRKAGIIGGGSPLIIKDISSKRNSQVNLIKKSQQ
jgi:hypothetical protein